MSEYTADELRDEASYAECEISHGERVLILPEEWIKLARAHAAREEELARVQSVLSADIRNLTEKVIPNIGAERDAAVKDAERYRWLSEQSMIEDGEAEVLLLDLNNDGSSECYYKYHGIALDAAIDAAIAAKGER